MPDWYHVYSFSLWVTTNLEKNSFLTSSNARKILAKLSIGFQCWMVWVLQAPRSWLASLQAIWQFKTCNKFRTHTKLSRPSKLECVSQSKHNNASQNSNRDTEIANSNSHFQGLKKSLRNFLSKKVLNNQRLLWIIFIRHHCAKCRCTVDANENFTSFEDKSHT